MSHHPYRFLASLLLIVALPIIVSCAHAPEPRTDYAATFTEWAVACDHEMASRAGEQMLAAGGNAVDAAVAASFCLSVVRPFSCGIGGGGFMVISLPPSPSHPERRAIALDYRESCPAAVGPRYFENLESSASQLGVKAAAVPGTVAGLLYALENYGTLDRAAVLAPAIKAAHEGFAADAFHVRAMETMADAWRDHPELRGNLGTAWSRFALQGQIEVGDVIINQHQARALELVARDGAAAFYEGPIADAIMAVMEQNEGPMTRADLAAFQVRERPALVGDIGPWRILSMPPPSSGGVATQQIFGLLDRWYGLQPEYGQNSPEWRHLLIESFKHAFADRARWLADDAFSPVPVDRLTSAGYLDSLSMRLDPEHTPACRILRHRRSAPPGRRNQPRLGA